MEKRDEVKKSFQEFAAIVEEKLFVHKGLPFDEAFTYGVDLDADYDAHNVRIIDGHYVFDVKTPNGSLTDVGILFTRTSQYGKCGCGFGCCRLLWVFLMIKLKKLYQLLLELKDVLIVSKQMEKFTSTIMHIIQQN